MAGCPPGSPVPDTALAAVRRFCDTKVPARHRDELRVECDVRAKAITIYECRPPWHPNLGPDWTRQRVAQLGYDPEDHYWRSTAPTATVAGTTTTWRSPRNSSMSSSP